MNKIEDFGDHIIITLDNGMKLKGLKPKDKNHNLIIENCNRFLVYVVETGNCLGWVSKEAISVININENGDVSYENI